MQSANVTTWITACNPKYNTHNWKTRESKKKRVDKVQNQILLSWSEFCRIEHIYYIVVCRMKMDRKFTLWRLEPYKRYPQQWGQWNRLDRLGWHRLKWKKKFIDQQMNEWNLRHKNMDQQEMVAICSIFFRCKCHPEATFSTISTHVHHFSLINFKCETGF